MRKGRFPYDRKSNREKREAARQASALARDLTLETGVPHEWKWTNGCYFVFTRDEDQRA